MATIFPSQAFVYWGLPGGGLHRVTGSTKNTGTPTTPVRRRVRLHDQIGGRAVRELWSDATTGAYAFNHIAPGTYYVVSFDHTNTHPGVIADNLTAEPMP